MRVRKCATPLTLRVRVSSFNSKKNKTKITQLPMFYIFGGQIQTLPVICIFPLENWNIEKIQTGILRIYEATMIGTFSNSLMIGKLHILLKCNWQ